MGEEADGRSQRSDLTESAPSMKSKSSQIMGLYQKGYPDSEIAKILGITRSAVVMWRNKRGLRPNIEPLVFSRTRELLSIHGLPEEWSEEILELYSKYRKDIRPYMKTLDLDILSLIQLLCRRYKVPVPYEIVKATFRHRTKRRKSGYMHALQTLDGVEFSSPRDYIRFFDRTVGLTNEELLRVFEVLTKIRKEMIVGKNPRVVAGAILYSVLKETRDFTQEEISKILQITPVALRNFWKVLRDQV
jgi:transcription initiation factor TFIIIB Brf1 subunit/transcription initiation factor TFIIB